MNTQPDNPRDDGSDQNYWRNVAHSWRHLACWSAFAVGFLWWMAVIVAGETAGDSGHVVLMICALAGLYNLDTARLRQRIAELEGRRQPPSQSEDNPPA